ncbi:flippase [Thermodesulfobacterium hydrogeniphilum]|uniref:flippase n=1 Tax=Thermodesulfobacterium hydrogeniphilum TaxID=161156 RepID=UPI0005706028|nr:flippase [Thermodesulfobacterium hydrogeniphilum]
MRMFQEGIEILIRNRGSSGTKIIEKIKTKLSGDIHFKELVQGGLTFLILRILGMGVAYAFTLTVTRNLGASAWGIFALNFTVLQITSVIGRLGLDTALLRFIAEYNAQGKGKTAKYVYFKSISLVIPFSLTLSVTLYFLAPILAESVFNKKYLNPYIRLMAFGVLPFTLLFINSESLRAFKKIKEYTTFQNLFPFLVALFVVWTSFTFLNFKKTELVLIAFILGIVTSLIFSSVFLWKELKKLSGKKENINIRYILSVSFPMLMSSSLAFIMAWTDTIMLGIFRTEEEVGIYNVAVRLSMITSFTLVAINSIAAPKFAEFWGKKDIKGLARVAQQSTKLIFWTSFPVLLIFLIFPKPILYIFGEEFKTGALALMILTIGQFVNAAAGSVGYILQMTGHQKFHQNVVLIGTLLNILLNWMLIPAYGIVGAAIASAISMIFWNIVFSVKVASILNKSIFYIPFYREKFDDQYS